MTLRPGYNIVGRKYEDFSQELTILEFLEYIYKKKRFPSKITVTGLEILIINAYDPQEMMNFIRNLLRDAQSNGLIRPATIIQIIVNGKIMKDINVKIKIKDEYIQLEKLFYGEIDRLAPDWVHVVR